jgi:hypothetical protein
MDVSLHEMRPNFFTIKFRCSLKFSLLSICTPKYFKFFASSICSLSMLSKVEFHVFLRLLVMIMYFVFATFSFNLLNFSHFDSSFKSSCILIIPSSTFSPDTDKRVSSAERFTCECMMVPPISFMYKINSNE